MTNWRERGACRATPDLWFDASFRTSAVHICRAHCPVVRECHEWAAGALIVSGVAGGLAHGDNGEAMTSWGNGKDATRCTPSCRAFRRTAGEGEE